LYVVEKMERRDFLKRTACVAISSTIPSYLYENNALGINLDSYRAKLYTIPEGQINQSTFLDENGASRVDTLFEVTNDFDLKGQKISLPDRSILFFRGGSFKNGELVGNNTTIYDAQYKVFEGVSFSGVWNVEEVNVKWFGALGDGKTDDTKAVKKAHEAAYNFAVGNKTLNMIVKLPHGLYKLSGDKIFGATIEDEKNYHTRVNYIFYGCHSKLLWSPKKINDSLFYFNSSIYRENVYQLSIVVNSNLTKTMKSGIVFRMASGTPYATSATNLYHEVSIGFDGKDDDVKGCAKYVWYITGAAHCDCTLVEHCLFDTFETLFYTENPESVNWIFNRCGFCNWLEHSVFFYHKGIVFDNFTVTNSSFSILKNYNTLIKRRVGNKDISNSTLSFSFENNRVEFQGGADKITTIVDCDYGYTKIKDCSFALSGGKGKQVYKLARGARLLIEDALLRNPEFYIPIYTKGDPSGNKIQNAILLNRVTVPHETVFKIFDHINDKTYPVSDVLANRSFDFRNVNVTNMFFNSGDADSTSFTIKSDRSYNNTQPRLEEKTIIVETNGSTGDGHFFLPPYSMITSVSLLWTSDSLSKKKLRLNVGEKSLFGNPHYDFDLTAARNQTMFKQYCAFEGFCGMLNDSMQNEYSLELQGESVKFVAKITYTQYQNFCPEMAMKSGGSYKPFCV